MAKAEPGFASELAHRSETENPLLRFWTAVQSSIAAFVAQLKHRKKPSTNDLAYLWAARTVSELSELDADCTYGCRVSEQSRARATQLLVALERINRSQGYRVPAPAVASTPDGGVLLAWYVATPAGELEVEAIALDKDGEFYVGYSDVNGIIQQAPLDDIEAVARQIGRTLLPHL